LISEPNHDLGDQPSREAFVQATYAQLFCWFCRLTGSPDRSADLTQETFAAFWEGMERMPRDIGHRLWLYAIGRNVWRKQARDHKVLESVLPDQLRCAEPQVEKVASDREFGMAADRALRDLPQDLREAFLLRFWHDMSYEEIGMIQGVSPSLVRWRYFAARRRLVAKLAAWDPDQGRSREQQHAT
jgi:RNA polymerase sigma-70 factor (ECF subfamily)